MSSGSLQTPKPTLLRSADSPEDEPLRKRPRTNPREGEFTTNRRKKACQTCSLRKVKCDAARPVCAYCDSTDSTCVYLDREKLTLESATDILAVRLDEIHSKLEQLQQQRSCPTDTEDVLQHSSNVAGFPPSKDFVQMPAQRPSADAVFAWPIFGDKFSFNTLTDAVFQHHASGALEQSSLPNMDLPPKEWIPGLVDKFFKNVHTKNPILDVELLLEHSRRIVREGFDWDPYSCLVLLACALGSIAEPFSILSRPDDGYSPRLQVSEQALQQGEAYLKLASYRLGALRATLVGIQCQFYAGVYAMYTLRPLLAWQHFISSSTLYQLYDKIEHGPTGRDIASTVSVASSSDPLDVRTERLEQCLYWSCFKSESEFRVELPLAMTEIGSYSHPEMFPIPPTPQEPAQCVPRGSSDSVITSAASVVSTESVTRGPSLKLGAKGVYHEEESWYYYLTEIALRRIGNRIVNTFFHQEPRAWLTVEPLLRIAVELDTQVSEWSANLPPVMQHWQSIDTIRDPKLGHRHRGSTSHVSQELSWAIENRLLEVRSWLYQPFLFYLIHHQHFSRNCQLCNHVGNSEVWTAQGMPMNEPPDSRSCVDVRGDKQHVLVRRLVASGIECNLRILESRIQNHRHHGVWFDLRSITCASLILLAVVKSGHEAWIPGGAKVLWGTNMYGDTFGPINGEIGRAIAHLKFWARWCPEMTRHHEVLEAVAHETRSVWLRRTAKDNQTGVGQKTSGL